MSSAAIALFRRHEDDLARIAVPALLFAVIGIEIVALLSWAPDTLGSWFNPDRNGYGDFPVFYRNARTFSFNALYSPGLAVIMHPLTYLDQRQAFGVYTGVNVAALCGVAFVAQRAVTSWPAKVAIVLGMLALPQTHWSMRVGHFTQILALAALGGLLLSDRKPVAAGLFIAMLALKPQYLPVPLLYLLFTRNWRALATVFGAFVVLGVAGIAASALRDPAGLRMFMYAGDYYHERIPEAWTFLTVGQRDQLYPQGWQYSWYGFLLSTGQQPNPLVAGDLMLLTLGAVGVAWWKCTPSVAKVAAALGMLMLAPHSSFYNWSMLSVAAALLLHSDLRPRALVPAILVVMAIAAAASQAATPFPLPYDAYRPASTLGIYWVQPAALLTIIVLAVFGRRTADAPEHTSDVRVRLAQIVRASTQARRASYAGVATAAVVAGAFVGAYVTGAGPFRTDAYFGRTQVLAALPQDFPAPPLSTIEETGAGAHYPYRVEWQADASTSEVAGLMRQQLDDGTWRVVEASRGDDATTFRSARSADGGLPVIAEVHVEPDGAGSRVRVEFSPLPSSSVRGYQRWLQHIGLVVHDIDPHRADTTPAH